MSDVKLIALYFYVSERYEEELKYCCQRFSNNDEPLFSDAEVLTIYLYCLEQEQRQQVKQIYSYCRDHLLSWFPRLPSYQAFNHRINRLSEVLRRLSEDLLEQASPPDREQQPSLVDSLPIMTYRGAGHGQVAPEIATKGYCSTKRQYYYGVKLHALGFHRKGTLPLLEGVVLSSADENDLTIFKEHFSDLDHRTFLGDKIYYNEPWFAWLRKEQHCFMHTPVKMIKGMSHRLRQWDRAADDLYSHWVSRMRQPIESLFNWLIEKTKYPTGK